MRWIWSFVFAFLLIASIASFAQALDSGTIFSVGPGTKYKCVYISLPQDLGVSGIESTTETIIEANKDNNPWADTTYSKVVMEPGVLNKNPICFYYSDKKEGEFSFYNIILSSRDLGVSNSILGGLCVSNYEDVDTGVEVNNKSDVCGLLNENADIVDLSFSEDPVYAKKGEVVSRTLYVTSYADARIKLSIATNLQNDFGEPVVATSPSKPMVSKTFKIKAPESEGDFEVTFLAQIDGCGIKACRKQKEVTIKVNESEKAGFTLNVIPKNINIKETKETLFRVIVSNEEETQEFSVEVISDPPLTIEPASKTFSVDKGEEMTAIFSVTPGDEKLYKIDFKVMTASSEKLFTSYLSIGELLSDAMRYSEEVEKISTPDLKEEISKARDAYEQNYNKTSYGEDIKGQEDFLNTLDEVKKKAEGGGETTPEDKPTQPGFNWAIVAIPIVIIAAIVLLFIVFRKAKTSGSEDSGYGGYGYPGRKDERE